MQLSELFDITANTDEELVITTSGKVITLELPSLSAGINLWRSQEEKLKRLTHETHESLKALGMQLQIRVEGRVIAQLGEGAQPSLLARLLDFGPMQLQPYEALRLLLGIEPA